MKAFLSRVGFGDSVQLELSTKPSPARVTVMVTSPLGSFGVSALPAAGLAGDAPSRGRKRMKRIIDTSTWASMFTRISTAVLESATNPVPWWLWVAFTSRPDDVPSAFVPDSIPDSIRRIASASFGIARGVIGTTAELLEEIDEWFEDPEPPAKPDPADQCTVCHGDSPFGCQGGCSFERRPDGPCRALDGVLPQWPKTVTVDCHTDPAEVTGEDELVMVAELVGLMIGTQWGDGSVVPRGQPMTIGRREICCRLMVREGRDIDPVYSKNPETGEMVLWTNAPVRIGARNVDRPLADVVVSTGWARRQLEGHRRRPYAFLEGAVR